MKKSSTFSEEDVTLLLEKKFCAPEWAFFSQVANGTGGTSSRRADGVAFNLWPSRGMAIHGFEIKVSRRDWLNELKNPGKSEDIQKFCDHWWIVAPKDVIMVGEVPKTWGHFEAQKGRLVTVKEAPELSPVMVDRPFLAALMRKLDSKSMLPEEIKARVTAAHREGELAGAESARWKVERLERELSSLRKNVEKFEELSGINIEFCNVENVAARYKLFCERGSDQFVEAMSMRLESMKKLTHDLEEKIKLARLEIRNAGSDS